MQTSIRRRAALIRLPDVSQEIIENAIYLPWTNQVRLDMKGTTRESK